MSGNTTQTTLLLPKNEAHIWLVDPRMITSTSLLEQYFPLMNEAESVQQQRFYREVDRHRYLVTRALVRTTLSRYIQRSPDEWEFVFNEYKRPDIAPQQQEIPLRFNLSHTRGMIACLVNLEQDAGVDVEDITRSTGVMNIANYSFASGETEALLNADPERQKHLFFQYWTLKEAYIKAKGMGLALPLNRFSFHRSRDRSICIEFQPGMADSPEHWQFVRYEPSEQHILSVALHRPNRPRFAIRVFQVTPLGKHQELHLSPVAHTP